MIENSYPVTSTWTGLQTNDVRNVLYQCLPICTSVDVETHFLYCVLACPLLVQEIPYIIAVLISELKDQVRYLSQSIGGSRTRSGGRSFTDRHELDII